MSYIDLVNKLTEKDKTLITNYINEYEIKYNFIGVDEWLQDWSHSNQRLYKLLGNQFMKEYDFIYTRNVEEIKSELDNLSRHSFIKDYEFFIESQIYPNKFNLTYEIKRDLADLIYLNRSFNENGELNFLIKFKIEGRKTFQLQKGTKLLKVFYRIMEYFKEDYNFNKNYFENFKTKYSLLLNDKLIKGKMVLSIHPLDYMTMSDNASNWTSCMSWIDQGCYHLGTVEMMNSNNVLIVYLKTNDDNFYFKKEKQKEDKDSNFIWNDKKWRVLTYVTKDIIMSGKAYPYINNDFCKFIIAKIKDLAKENLNWNYSFGPELYQDMIHIYGTGAIENQKSWRKYNPRKYNIIWDTKAMYNDMLNAKIKYWCYRNKVNKNKIISVSGKSTCLCCGNSATELNEDEYYYNDRYSNADKIVCYDCTKKYFTCDYCESLYFDKPTYTVFSVEKQKEVRLCQNCYDNKIKECPVCGNPFIFNVKKLTVDYNEEKEGVFVLKNEYNEIPFPKKIRIVSVIKEHDLKDNNNDIYNLSRLCCCSECEKKLRSEAISTTVTRYKLMWYGGYGNEKQSEIKVIINSDLIKYTNYYRVQPYKMTEKITKIY